METYKLVVLQPTGADSIADLDPAQRVETLNGKRIGLVWNNKDYGDKLLIQVQDLIHQRYPEASFELYRLRDCCVAPPEGELERIANEVDSVVYVLGD
jgi:hypothetical protein